MHLVGFLQPRITKHGTTNIFQKMYNVFVHTHKRYTYTFSVHKEKKQDQIYAQLYLKHKEVLRVSAIHVGVTERHSGTTQNCPCGMCTTTELKTITTCDNSGTLVI